MNTLTLVSILLYVAVLFILSALCVKKVLYSYEEYSYCGRSLSIGYIFFTYLGTWIGGGAIIGLIGRSYSEGASQYWLLGFSYVIGFFFAFIFITRIRKLNVKGIGDFLTLRYPEHNELIRIPVMISIIIRNVTMIGMQFCALAYMITYSFGIDRNLAVLIIFVVITSYTVLSGLWGVVVTDIFQGILQSTGIILLLVTTVKLSGGIDGILEFYKGAGIENSLKLLDFSNTNMDIFKYAITFGGFFLIADQSDWERLYASKTDKIAFWGFITPLFITLISLLVLTYVGVFQRAVSFGNIRSEYVLYEFIFEFVDTKLAIFILIGLLATTMSSSDSFMLASGNVFSNDFIKRFINPKAGDKELIFWTRSFVIVAGAIGFAFAINVADIITLWLAGIALSSMILFPAYISAWFSKHINTTGALAGMTVGIIFTILLVLGVLNPSVENILIGMSANFITSLIVSKLGKKPSEEVVSRTFYWSPRFKSTKNVPR